MKSKKIIVTLIFMSASIFAFSEKLNIILGEYYPDSYDALRSERPYKKSFSHEESVNYPPSKDGGL
ncbi:hypothetical protein HWHPT5561_00255 [Petrotoga sp. HWH.PT.55.6.1]|uniref:hypothetical protein n=1 Tax=unclassified Petrotoga TaxID=2620614 RepID=UPI000CA073C7|nr:MULTISPECIES: hypothetical protein [unclassified Petrotoga]PNR90254.1 hypothetical protein X925_00200 [Petrotoga sp. 9T1HF07.CasAA.8.2]PNR93332.1 hypothetical protein X926_03570 [Petrotoga sp. HWHPT.55.6.3]RPD36706.1 hypothetical protein HWHPT5561_00255 [Petrotoga sp. HWH.PT.55.6.1]